MAKGNDFFTMGSTKSSSLDQPHHCSRSIVCVGSRPNPPRETKTPQEGFPRSNIPPFVYSKRLFTSSYCKRGSIDLQKGLKSFSMASLPSIVRSVIYQQEYGLHESTISSVWASWPHQTINDHRMGHLAHLVFQRLLHHARAFMGFFNHLNHTRGPTRVKIHHATSCGGAKPPYVSWPSPGVPWPHQSINDHRMGH